MSGTTGCLFSVIIPTYGRPVFLDEAIRSVLAQTVQDFECVVVDDGSPTPVEVPMDPRVRLVRRADNGGPAVARNTGIADARGRYIVFLDDDDVLMPERLAIAMEGLARAPIALCWRGNRDDDRPVRNRLLEGMVHGEILEAEVPHLGQTAIDASIVPTFDEHFVAAEDTEWWLRASRSARVTTVPRTGYLLRRHDAPRHRNDLTARLRHRLLLLDMYAEYFSKHPRGRAFQWKRLGLMAQRLGDNSLGRKAFWRSFRAGPDPTVVWHFMRSLRPSIWSADTAPLGTAGSSVAVELDRES